MALNIDDVNLENETGQNSHIIFTIQEWNIAIPIRQIYRIAEIEKLDKIDKTSTDKDSYLKGTINENGEIIQVFDISNFYINDKKFKPGLVAECINQGTDLIGIMFENIADIIEIEPSTINRSIDKKVGFDKKFIDGFSVKDDQIITYINFNKIK